MRLLAALLSLLTSQACKPAGGGPKMAGVSTDLIYPALLIGQASLDLRDSEDSLISITGASSLNLPERLILDSDGRLFTVVEATPVAGTKSILLDMGTSRRKFFVELKERPRPTFPGIKELLLEQVKSPASIWAGDPRAVARVNALGSIKELIEACRESWNWNR